LQLKNCAKTVEKVSNLLMFMYREMIELS